MDEREPDMAVNADIVPLSIAVEGGLAIIAVLAGWLLRVDVRDLLHLDSEWDLSTVTRVALLGGLSALPMLGVLVAIETVPWEPVERLKQFTRDQLQPLFRSTSIGGLLAISVMAGFGEELLFRGLLQTLIARWLPLGIAVVAAGILFGIVHYATTTYAIVATVMGIYLGLLIALTGELWVPIIAHSLYDFVALTYLRFQPASDAPAGDA